MKALAKEKDLLEGARNGSCGAKPRRPRTAPQHCSQLDLKDNRMKELETGLAMVRPRPFAPTGWVGLPEVMSRSGSRRCWETRLAGGFTWEPGGRDLGWSGTQSQPHSLPICLGPDMWECWRDHPLTLGRKNTKKINNDLSLGSKIRSILFPFFLPIFLPCCLIAWILKGKM